MILIFRCILHRLFIRVWEAPVEVRGHRAEARSLLPHFGLLQRVTVQFPIPTWCLTSIHNSNSRALNVLFWPLEASGTHAVHIHTCRQNMQYIFKKKGGKELALESWEVSEGSSVEQKKRQNLEVD